MSVCGAAMQCLGPVKNGLLERAHDICSAVSQGDTAVAVHPEDSRFSHLVGQRCAVPLTDRHGLHRLVTSRLTPFMPSGITVWQYTHHLTRPKCDAR